MDAILNAIKNGETAGVLERMVLFFFYDQVLVMDRPAEKAMEIAKTETRIFMAALTELSMPPKSKLGGCGIDPCPTQGCD